MGRSGVRIPSLVAYPFQGGIIQIDGYLYADLFNNASVHFSNNVTDPKAGMLMAYDATVLGIVRASVFPRAILLTREAVLDDGHPVLRRAHAAGGHIRRLPGDPPFHERHRDSLVLIAGPIVAC